MNCSKRSMASCLLIGIASSIQDVDSFQPPFANPIASQSYSTNFHRSHSLSPLHARSSSPLKPTSARNSNFVDKSSKNNNNNNLNNKLEDVTNDLMEDIWELDLETSSLSNDPQSSLQNNSIEDGESLDLSGDSSKWILTGGAVLVIAAAYALAVTMSADLGIDLEWG